MCQVKENGEKEKGSGKREGGEREREREKRCGDATSGNGLLFMYISLYLQQNTVSDFLLETCLS